MLVIPVTCTTRLIFSLGALLFRQVMIVPFIAELAVVVAREETNVIFPKMRLAVNTPKVIMSLPCVISPTLALYLHCSVAAVAASGSFKLHTKLTSVPGHTGSSCSA